MAHDAALVTNTTDIKRTFWQWLDTSPLAAGASVSVEGAGMIAVIEDGIEKVKPAVGAASTEKVAGFAVFRAKSYTTDARVESGTVPSAAPYDIELGQNNLITGQIRVIRTDTNAAFTVVAIAPAAATEVQVDYVSGKLTFHSGAAGLPIQATYRYSLSAQEAIDRFQEAPANHPDTNLFGTVGVAKSKGRLFTLYYDAAVNWADPAQIVKLGANGILTGSAGSGPAVPNCRVVQVPASNDPYLGIEYIV